MLYDLSGVLTKMQTKSIPYTFNKGGYYIALGFRALPKGTKPE